MTATLSDTTPIEHLDFEPEEECDGLDCADPAHWLVLNQTCGCRSHMCHHHAARFRGRRLEVAIWICDFCDALVGAGFLGDFWRIEPLP